MEHKKRQHTDQGIGILIHLVCVVHRFGDNQQPFKGIPRGALRVKTTDRLWCGWRFGRMLQLDFLFFIDRFEYACTYVVWGGG